MHPWVKLKDNFLFQLQIIEIGKIEYFGYFKAVIVDHEYLDTEYETTLNKIKYLVDQIIRDDLRDGIGISVRYYSWTEIRFNKGG